MTKLETLASVYTNNRTILSRFSVSDIRPKNGRESFVARTRYHQKITKTFERLFVSLDEIDDLLLETIDLFQVRTYRVQMLLRQECENFVFNHFLCFELNL